MGIVTLSVLWICWCCLHSLLIDASFFRLVKDHLPGLVRYYRLGYNGLSILTVAPLIIATRLAEGQLVFNWGGAAGFVVRGVLLVTAALLFWGGAKEYDLYSFLGVRQLQSGKEQLFLGKNVQFVETGVLAVTRHPWYLGSLLLLWTYRSSYPLPSFLAVSILSFYLVIGTFLEERKILVQCGDSYRSYQRRVSMLFPWKWLKRLLH